MKEDEFFKQLGLLLKAGATLPEALENIRSDFPRHASHISKIQLSIEIGCTLSDALRTTKGYSDNTISLIEAAERNDTIFETLLEIARFNYLQREFKKRIKGIFIYPVIVIFLNLTIWLFLCSYLLPQFALMYDDLLDGGPLPGLTELVLYISGFVSSHFNSITISFLVSFVVIILMLTELIKIKLLNNFGFSLISVFSRFPSDLNTSKFCSFLAIHLKHGKDYPSTFKTCSKIINDNSFKKELTHAAKKISEGQHLNETILSMNKIDPLAKHLLTNTDEGEMSHELGELSNFFYQRSHQTMDRFVALFNIFLIFLTATIIGLSIIAMYLPMISLVNDM